MANGYDTCLTCQSLQPSPNVIPPRWCNWRTSDLPKLNRTATRIVQGKQENPKWSIERVVHGTPSIILAIDHETAILVCLQWLSPGPTQATLTAKGGPRPPNAFLGHTGCGLQHNFQIIFSQPSSIWEYCYGSKLWSQQTSNLVTFRSHPSFFWVLIMLIHTRNILVSYYHIIHNSIIISLLLLSLLLLSLLHNIYMIICTILYYIKYRATITISTAVALRTPLYRDPEPESNPACVRQMNCSNSWPSLSYMKLRYISMFYAHKTTQMNSLLSHFETQITQQIWVKQSPTSSHWNGVQNFN